MCSVNESAFRGHSAHSFLKVSLWSVNALAGDPLLLLGMIAID